ncbi:MAG: SprT family zinc-dependent metalloprotease [Bacteroidales bacterium]|jgi:predicted metal-dependent hydrolase|nr:SprT family zinc-dependent metalloprotease [Bacteroidales bacterium]
MAAKTIDMEGIGEVIFRKNKRSKNISISLRPGREVLVTFPVFVSYATAKKITEQKKEWIKTHQPKIKALEDKYTLFTEKTSLTTRSRTLKINKHDKSTIKTTLSDRFIEIHYPSGAEIQSKEIQQKIKDSVIKALRFEAKEYLPQRVQFLAKKYNFTYEKVFIKNNKTLWGSCSGVNNINLNLHLIRLPDHLIDYIILHELCHTREKNHGRRFWNLMDSILGNARLYSKELKKYSMNIYTH